MRARARAGPRGNVAIDADGGCGCRSSAQHELGGRNGVPGDGLPKGAGKPPGAVGWWPALARPAEQPRWRRHWDDGPRAASARLAALEPDLAGAEALARSSRVASARLAA